MNVALILAGLLAGSYTMFMQGIIGTTPSDAVSAPMKLDEYLKTVKNLPRWHRELMAKNHILKVFRSQNGTVKTFEYIPLEFVLQVGDQIQIDTNKPAYKAELDQKTSAAKDYAFVATPGPSDVYLQYSKDVLELSHTVELTKFQSDTTLLFTLEQFAEKLQDDEKVVGPVRNVIVASHAHWSGMLLFDADFSGEPVSYEKVSSPDLAANLRVPDEAFQPRSAGSSKPMLIFKGCEFGQATAFLKKLHQIINPKTRLYAPLHWIGVGADSGSNDRYEYMGQRFFLQSKSLLTRSELLQRFHQLKMKDLRNNAIPNNRWDQGWPSDTALYRSPGFTFSVPARGVKHPAISGSGVSIPEHPININLVAFWCFRPRFQLSLSTNVTQSAFNANKIKALKDTLAARPDKIDDELTPAHPFPIWVRFRFHPVDSSRNAAVAAQQAWVDSLDWSNLSYSGGSGSARIQGIGACFLYELVVPICDSQGRLLLNYYAKAAPNNPVMEHLPLTDPTYWQFVE
jgi:hypothetical protein